MSNREIEFDDQHSTPSLTSSNLVFVIGIVLYPEESSAQNTGAPETVVEVINNVNQGVQVQGGVQHRRQTVQPIKSRVRLEKGIGRTYQVNRGRVSETLFKGRLTKEAYSCTFWRRQIWERCRYLGGWGPPCLARQKRRATIPLCCISLRRSRVSEHVACWVRPLSSVPGILIR